jgi:hypothetical protein
VELGEAVAYAEPSRAAQTSIHRIGTHVADLLDKRRGLHDIVP